MDPIKIIQKHYQKNSKLYNLLLVHSKLVTKKALEIARNVPELKPDLKFIEEAAMLHDIGIIFTNTPKIHCFGEHKYIEHGYLGRDLLEEEGLPKHALVAERHTGVGLTKEEIIKNKLPLPNRNMIPTSVEEKIISFADLFYTKVPGWETQEVPISEIKRKLAKHGKKNIIIFEQWCKDFKISSF